MTETIDGYLDGKVNMKYSNIRDGFTGIEGIPVIIPTFNNPTYLKSMVDFLLSRDLKNIVVLDNNSTYPAMVEYLEELSKDIRVINQPDNYGPRQFWFDEVAFSELPEYFIVTDPDLSFKKELPENFIDILKEILDEHQVFKVGCALDLDVENTLLDEPYVIVNNTVSIRHSEQSYYSPSIRIAHPTQEMYAAPIDTTFALYKKSNKHFGFMSSIRVAGDFKVHHHGWDLNLPMPQEEYDYYKSHMADTFASTEVLKRDGRIW